MQEAELILRTLDRHLSGPGTIRLLGGAALILGYELLRATEDADLLLDETELQALIDHCDIGAALEKTNLELADRGLYITHIWGPEQEILTPHWREDCRRVSLAGLSLLEVLVLSPLDLIVSKMCRADDLDLDDIRHLIRQQQLEPGAVRQAMSDALVPEVFREIFPGPRSTRS